MNAVANSAAVAELFRSIFLSEESGTLELRSADSSCRIFFDRGMVAGAEVDGASPSGAADAPADLERVITFAFSCLPSKLEFHPGTITARESQADILRTVNLFLLGVSMLAGFDEIHDALCALTQKLVLRTHATVPLERLTLKPLHGFVLSRLSGHMTLREIAATVGPEDEAEAVRFVFALLLLGSVALDPPFAHGHLQTELLLSDHKRDFARDESETSFIRDIYNYVQEHNPYQILGIDETTSPEDLNRAFEERKRAMSAERFLESVRERMRSELAIIDARLTEVYLTLQRGGAVSGGGAEGSGQETIDLDTLALRREVTKTDVAVSADMQEKLAESYYQKAKRYFGQGDYHNCIQYCTQAIRQSDQTARFYALLGEAQARNPDRRWQKMSERSLMQAIRLDPWNVDYLVSLGQFYKKQGFAVRARRQFERALELNPGNALAHEELQSLG